MFKIDEEDPEDFDGWNSQINKTDLEFQNTVSPTKLPLIDIVSETQSNFDFDLIQTKNRYLSKFSQNKKFPDFKERPPTLDEKTQIISEWFD